MIFRGTATALVTPFTAGNEIDLPAVRRLIDHQLQGDVDAILVLGTTGESPTVSAEERHRLVDCALEHISGRAPLIVGTGTNDTQKSVDYARHAAEAGAAGQLVVGPYYNKPTQEGFVRHVQALADATDLPIILYNIPGRTGFNASPETILRLAEDVETVVGVKEASGSLRQITDILAGRPETLAVYAGDDELALPVCLLGGDGVVSVISNALPGEFAGMVRHALEGRHLEARSEHFDLLGAMRACFVETNPIPIKAVLAEMGLIDENLRLPLMPLETPHREQLLAAFAPYLAVTA